ncbi:lysophospholipid acyltransferase family protein [Thermodesulfobacteriota bacterium]
MRQHILDSPVSYYAIFVLARLLPLKVCRWLGRVIASMVYIFSARDRKGFANNLSIALGKPADHVRIRQLVRRMFTNYGEYMADFFCLPQLPRRKAHAAFSHLKGEEIIQHALKQGRGVILLSAHIGNWEFGGTMMRLSKYPLAVVSLPHNSAPTNALVNRFREGKGIAVIEVDASPFSSLPILKHLRKNGVVAMIGDKDFFGNGKLIPYFGKQVRFPIGPVTIAMASGAALIPAFVLKQPDGRYFGVLESAIPLTNEGSREQAIQKNLEKIAIIFETYIQRYPDQWYNPDPIIKS